MPATKWREPAIAKGGMLSMATRVARYVVPHEMHTATQAQYARSFCLGELSGVRLNAEAINAWIKRAG
jgi:hypothetical protein